MRGTFDTPLISSFHLQISIGSNDYVKVIKEMFERDFESFMLNYTWTQMLPATNRLIDTHNEKETCTRPVNNFYVVCRTELSNQTIIVFSNDY